MNKEQQEINKMFEIKIDKRISKKDMFEYILNLHKQGYENNAMIFLAFYGLGTQMNVNELIFLNNLMGKMNEK